MNIIKKNILSTFRFNWEMTDEKNDSESRTKCEDSFETHELENALSEEVWL